MENCHNKGVHNKFQKRYIFKCIDEITPCRMLWKNIQFCCKKFAGRHKCNAYCIKQWKQHNKSKQNIRCQPKGCTPSSFCKSPGIHCVLYLQKLTSGNLSLYGQSHIFCLTHQYFTPFFSIRNIISVMTITIRNRMTDWAAALPKR